MAYALLAEVRKYLPGLDSAISDPSIEKALTSAECYINAILGECVAVPFAALPDTPALITCIAEHYAAGWALVGPGAVACTDNDSKQGNAYLKLAKEMLDSICRTGVVEPGVDTPLWCVYTSANKATGNVERVKRFPQLREPFLSDRRPVVNPEWGPRLGPIGDASVDPYGGGPSGF